MRGSDLGLKWVGIGGLLSLYMSPYLVKCAFDPLQVIVYASDVAMEFVELGLSPAEAAGSARVTRIMRGSPGLGPVWNLAS